MEPGGTVLLVEDQDAVRNMAESMLEHIGYKVLAASSGVEAIDLLRANPDLVHCVITDLSMPGMDGWETLAALRKILPHIPVILVSGHDEALAMTGNRSERPQVFLHKPYSLEPAESIGPLLPMRPIARPSIAAWPQTVADP